MLSFHDRNDNSGDLQVGLYGNLSNVVTVLGDPKAVITHLFEGSYYFPNDYKFVLRDDVLEWLDVPDRHYIRDRFRSHLGRAIASYNSALSMIRENDHQHLYINYMVEQGHFQIYMSRDHALLFKLEFL